MPTPPLLPRRSALALLATTLLACSRRSAGSAVPRVISISPSITEAAFAVGAGPLLVGRSSYCDYPPEVLALPAVGGYADPNIEAILALAPTLVIGCHGPAGPAIEQTLRAHGVDAYLPETESLAQIADMITELGRRLDRKDGAARVNLAIQRDRDDVHRAVAALAMGDGRPVKAALLFDVGPLVVAGPGSFPDELVREAGAINVISAGGTYPTIGLEHLLALDPDVLIDGMTDEQEAPEASRILAMRGAPGWRDLRALREGRVRPIPPIAKRPGPRIGLGLRAVARALHGDALLPAEASP